MVGVQHHPALAVIELGSIARGVFVVDALVKRAEVQLVLADPVTPGKLLIVFAGDVAEVEEALGAAREAAAEEELDVLFLPFVHPAVASALLELERPPIDGALGVLEMRTVAATILAGDAALKAADTRLVAMHLARGIGGKGYVVLTGAQDAVEASLDAGEGCVDPEHRAGRELIPRPHPDLDWALGRL